MIALVSGLVAGLAHVLAGPDHLAAVAPLSAGRPTTAFGTGVRWGFGHAAGVLFVGFLSLIFRELLPLDAFSFWAERFVGIVLIAIGLWGLRRALTQRLHAHEHAHGEVRHLHVHVHEGEEAHRHIEATRHQHSHTAFAVGTLHGLAGSSHLFGVLPSLAFPTNTSAIVYLVAFAFGTIVAMGLFSSMIGLFARGCAQRGAVRHRGLVIACSLAAVIVGGYWLIG